MSIKLQTFEVDEWGRRRTCCSHCGNPFWAECQYHLIGYCLDCAKEIGAAVYIQHGGLNSVPKVLQSERLERKIEGDRLQRNKVVYLKKPVSDELRWEVFERDGYRCLQCGSKRCLTVDHIVPERHDGPATLENLQTLCRPCNSKKGACQ